MTHFAPQDRVLVSPRHLAGAGTDRLANAIHPLIRLFGRPNEHECERTVSSPEGTLFVSFTSRRTRTSRPPRAVLEGAVHSADRDQGHRHRPQTLPQLIGYQGRAAAQSPGREAHTTLRTPPLNTLRSQPIRPR